MKVLAVGAEVEDGVADELPGAVVGDVTAAFNLDDVHTARREPLWRNEEMLAAARAAERHDRRVLAEEEGVGHLARLAAAGEVALEGQRLGIGDTAEGDDLDCPLLSERGHPGLRGLRPLRPGARQLATRESPSRPRRAPPP